MEDLNNGRKEEVKEAIAKILLNAGVPKKAVSKLGYNLLAKIKNMDLS